MERKNVRIPNQKRSVEKKERIIETANKIFFEKGYFSTNTAEIASDAGISTGSLYAYFKDKKDILLECLKRYGEALKNEIFLKIENISITEDVLYATREVLHLLSGFHINKKLFHDEIMSLRFVDEDIRNYFISIEKVMMSAVVEQIKKRGLYFKNEQEQTYLIFNMIEAIEDELAFHLSPNINRDTLIDECAHIIMSMLEKK